MNLTCKSPLLPLLILPLFLAGCGPSASQTTPSPPTEQDVKVAFKRFLVDQKQIEADRIGLPIGANITYGDLQVVKQQCYKSFQNDQSPEDYMCGVAWTFRSATKIPIDSFRMWKNELGTWKMEKLHFSEAQKVFDTLAWPD